MHDMYLHTYILSHCSEMLIYASALTKIVFFYIDTHMYWLNISSVLIYTCIGLKYRIHWWIITQNTCKSYISISYATKCPHQFPQIHIYINVESSAITTIHHQSSFVSLIETSGGFTPLPFVADDTGRNPTNYTLWLNGNQHVYLPAHNDYFVGFF